MTKSIELQVELDKLNDLAKNNVTKLSFDSENYYKNQIGELVDDFLTNPDLRFIMLAGPSSAGKTTTSKMLRIALEGRGIHSIVISLDDFFLNRENTPLLPDGSYDFENITALDLPYYNKFLKDLLETGKGKMPEFDFKLGQRKKDYIDIEADKNTIVIFEGIHALNPLLIGKEFDKVTYKVYLSLRTDLTCNGKMLLAAKDLRLMRRILRDYQTRGHSVESTIKMWDNVLDGENKYIKPFKNAVNFMVNTMHLYEPNLYATYLLPVLKRAEHNEKVDKLISVLEQCTPLTKDCVPQSSLLWEFLVL